MEVSMNKKHFLYLLTIFIAIFFIPTVYAVEKTTGRVAATNGLKLREGPTTASNKIITIPHNTRVTITSYSEIDKSSGCDDKWAEIIYDGNSTSYKGYVCSTYLADIETTTTEEPVPPKEDKPTEESRGKLYYWMKQVIDIVRPKIFIAENVKGLVNLGNVKEIIQKDFASADGNGYIVLNPQVLHAGNYGVPESRERVIFIGIRRDALVPEALNALEKDNIPDEYNPYPKPTHACTVKREGLLPIVTTYDVLKDLKEPDKTLDPSQSVYSKAKYLSNGSQGQTEIKLDGLGPTIRSEHHGNIEFRRLSAEHGGKHTFELNIGLPERRLTPRECAMIQTFPPDYEFVIKKKTGRGYNVSSSGAYKIIGNAVSKVYSDKEIK